MTDRQAAIEKRNLTHCDKPGEVAANATMDLYKTTKKAWILILCG